MGGWERRDVPERGLLGGREDGGLGEVRGGGGGGWRRGCFAFFFFLAFFFLLLFVGGFGLLLLLVLVLSSSSSSSSSSSTSSAEDAEVVVELGKELVVPALGGWVGGWVGEKRGAFVLPLSFWWIGRWEEGREDSLLGRVGRWVGVWARRWIGGWVGGWVGGLSVKTLTHQTVLSHFIPAHVTGLHLSHGREEEEAFLFPLPPTHPPSHPPTHFVVEEGFDQGDEAVEAEDGVEEEEGGGGGLDGWEGGRVNELL